MSKPCVNCGRTLRGFLARGRCSSCYSFFRRHGTERPAEGWTATHRFWALVAVGDPSTCWTWQGWRNRDGYGMVERGGRPIPAHRMAYMLAHGAIPDGQNVLHTFDNRPCVNPAHLWLGTRADNNADMRAKGRHAAGDRHGSRTHPEAFPHGERHPSRKLTEQDVRMIRIRYGAGGVTRRQLAAEYSVTQSTIGKVVLGAIWKEISI